MTYRDDAAAALERLGRARAQVAIARARPVDPDVEALRRQRGEIARARRSVRRLRHPIWRLLPASLSELVITAGYAVAVFLFGLWVGSPIGELIVAARTLPWRVLPVPNGCCGYASVSILSYGCCAPSAGVAPTRVGLPFQCPCF